MYSEDLPEFNMFDYLATGIKDQPTLHYMRTYWLAVEQSLMYKMSSSFCLGPTPKHIIFFNYLKSFFRAYKNSPMFLFSLFNEASHDYVNTVGAIDKDLYDFLRSSFNEGLFNHSVVFILGDHGNRIDPIRTTEVGRIEDRMPMVSVIVPKWIDSIYPNWKSAVRENSRRLLSSYDIHATLLDILLTLKKQDTDISFKYEFLKESGLNHKLASHFSADSVGNSFFKLVSLNRNCESAGIPDWFCVCLNNKEQINPDDPRSVKAAKAVVKYFNSGLLKNLPNCAEQNLVKVERSELIKNQNEYRIQLMFRTMPGDGVFEALVNVKDKGATSVYDIVGEVLRINHYGTQADCLPRTLLANNTILRGVCYCI
uniref:Sulfatase N-terminal domain-containing protein n=1 Tax=Clastoptera arizonana TaxID=38151 RepID=A0A1B6DLV6_9HEMI